MSGSQTKKDRIKCMLSALIVIGCYAIERFVTLLASAGESIYLIEAIVFSIAVAVVYFIVIKSKDSFYGLLPAILGFRMLPPTINNLGASSLAGEMVYYIVGRFSVIIFAFAIIRLYRKQHKKNAISVLSILALIFVVPFSNEIGDTISQFILQNSQSSMLPVYFVKFACYAAALAVILVLATRNNKPSARLIADYTMVALCVNAARRLVIIVYSLTQSVHISKSYFCWLAIYAVYFVAFFLIRKKQLK